MKQRIKDTLISKYQININLKYDTAYNTHWKIELIKELKLIPISSYWIPTITGKCPEYEPTTLIILFLASQQSAALGSLVVYSCTNSDIKQFSNFIHYEYIIAGMWSKILLQIICFIFGRTFFRTKHDMLLRCYAVLSVIHAFEVLCVFLWII